MAEIIELQQGELLPSGKWYEMYGPPFVGDPINYVMFAFKNKFDCYPRKIYTVGQLYYAELKHDPKAPKMEEQNEKEV